MEKGEENRVDLQRYRTHKKTVPWKLIRKIVVVIILMGLLYYMKSTLDNKEVRLPTEVELDLIN